MLPWFPGVSEMQGLLRSSGPNTASIILNRFQPHLHTAPGTIKTGGGGVTGEKSFHSKSPCFCFPGQTQEISLSAEPGGGWYATLFSAGVKTIVLAVLCFGRVQFNPRFPAALTKPPPPTPLQTHIALADLSKRSPVGGGVEPCLRRLLHARTRYPEQNQK